MNSPPKDLLIASAVEILRLNWYSGGLLIVVGAIGAVTRLIAPLLNNKEDDPAVIVCDERGMNFVPLLGGHKAGAEDWAFQLAEELGGNVVLTGHTRNQDFLPLDSFGESWGWKRSGNSSQWHQLMVHQANGGLVQIEQTTGTDWWRTSKGAEKSLAGAKSNSSQEVKSLNIGSKAMSSCCWHPATLWIGIGCVRNTTQKLIERSLQEVFLQSGLAQEAVAGLASIDIKADELAFLSLSKQKGWPIRFFAADKLLQVSVPTPSKEVESHIGIPSVAEAAALLAAGKSGVLQMKKQIFHSRKDEEGAVTIAIAEAIQPFAPALGELHLIGSGPGELSYLTHDARAALARSTVWIGYGRYLDLLEPLRRSDQVRIDGQLTFEIDRCKQAFGLAKEGIRVALISSGESGIYGMAGLALEIWLEEPTISRPTFNIHPGISSMQIAAARLGAPLMNDFCTISLSDRLTPWSKIKERITGAAIGDFVIAIFNPRSRDRDWQLESAIKIVRKYRSANTPIALARQIGRIEEKIELFSLDNCPVNQVDMLTLVLIGNSQSLLKDGWFVTPRGYKSI